MFLSEKLSLVGFTTAAILNVVRSPFLGRGGVRAGEGGGGVMAGEGGGEV